MGKCSLTVALPVLSAMGISTSVLPTAVLSTHTGFPAPQVQPMTENLLPFAEHIASVGGSFDAISTGYLSDPQQAEAVCQVLDLFDGLKVIDPAIGDHGKLYSRITPEHVEAMTELCRRGDYLLPNVTEAAFLTGMPYRETCDGNYLIEMADALCGMGARGVIITGITWDPGYTGWAGMLSGRLFSYRARKIPCSQHGTGDMFAAATTGALTRGKPLHVAATLGAKFVEKTMAVTVSSTPFGANFEPILPWLWEQL
jgi:pyridoxine kinase